MPQPSADSTPSRTLACAEYTFVCLEVFNISIADVNCKTSAYIWAESFRDYWVRLRNPFLRQCSDIFSTIFVTLRLP